MKHSKTRFVSITMDRMIEVILDMFADNDIVPRRTSRVDGSFFIYYKELTIEIDDTGIAYSLWNETRGLDIEHINRALSNLIERASV